MTGHTNSPNISRAELAELHRRKVAARAKVQDYLQSVEGDLAVIEARIRASRSRTRTGVGGARRQAAALPRKGRKR